ncbi:alpha/beta hydrolase-fold protein [Terriglobus sp. RCC_193]|uniref:alpha/beta hydrolase-fold protein n=1 Tax=Terriglobus sp. RCC_193 TaxID=3239218 RepID=UPI0035266FA0
MNDLTRRAFMKVSSMAGALLAGSALPQLEAQQAPDGNARDFQAAGGPGGPGRGAKKAPGIQTIYALCEVTGGGKKVYGIAIQYDAVIDPSSLALDTYTANVFPAVRGAGGGMMGAPGGPGGGGLPGGPVMAQNATVSVSKPRTVAAVYTNAEPGLLNSRKDISGKYVIAEFAHDPDLSAQSADSDRVSIAQDKGIKTIDGRVYAATTTGMDNVAGRGNNVMVRGISAWEQSHWWWDDTRSAMLEYSIYLPKSFLKNGGENKEYPLVIAITHSGTSYTGTSAETLTDGVIASIWGLPEEQAQRECVVITPRYERTTMNDYWEHTYDVENTYRLVESFLKNTWNYGNPNLEDRVDKVLKIDPKRVYTTGWSMGAMTSLWMMAKHPQTFAAGLIIAGQQRPGDVVNLTKQNVLILTGENDAKSTTWNEKCVPIWEQAGAKVTRPQERLDPALIFPISDQKKLTAQIDDYLGKGGNITFLTFADVDHMGAARKFFYIEAAKRWLLRQQKV